MFEHDDKQFADVSPALPEASAEPTPAVEANADEHRNGVAAPEGAAVNGPVVEEKVSPASEDAATAGGWRVEAGRKGAQRIHQLIENGKLYEQEHGLKSGRQRLRQLIEEGKLYEKEHGLTPERRRARGSRPRRLSSEQQVLSFLQAVLRLAKPRFRSQVARLLQILESEKN
jgi:hypothetical protein